MKKENFSAPKVGNVPASVVQQTLLTALSELFEQKTVHCELHTLGDDVVIVMMANGACATLHVQELKGGMA